jgi:hypothetical protein
MFIKNLPFDLKNIFHLRDLRQLEPPHMMDAGGGGEVDHHGTNFFGFSIQKFETSQFFSSCEPILYKIFNY